MKRSQFFGELEKEIEKSKAYFEPQSFEIISNRLNILGKKIVSLIQKFKTIEQEISENEGQIELSKQNLNSAREKVDKFIVDKEKLDKTKNRLF